VIPLYQWESSCVCYLILRDLTEDTTTMITTSLYVCKLTWYRSECTYKTAEMGDIIFFLSNLRGSELLGYQ
jgi:hypothetical protein